MDRQRDRYLRALGLTAWQQRPQLIESQRPQAIIPASATSDEPLQVSIIMPEPGTAAIKQERVSPSIRTKLSLDVSELGWRELAECVANCQACGLATSRTQTVFGIGRQDADLMVIGEAPGAEEDARGEPFVGRAGKLLDEMLVAMGLSRQQVYIANILKCRPPNNRDPSPEEANACMGYLYRQMVLVKPKMILVVGRIASQNLLGVTTPIGKLRGEIHRLHFAQGPAAGLPLVVTYHPAYLLRSPGEKAKAWQDLKLALTEIKKLGG